MTAKGGRDGRDHPIIEPLQRFNEGNEMVMAKCKGHKGYTLIVQPNGQTDVYADSLNAALGFTFREHDVVLFINHWDRLQKLAIRIDKARSIQLYNWMRLAELWLRDCPESGEDDRIAEATQSGCMYMARYHGVAYCCGPRPQGEWSATHPECDTLTNEFLIRWCCSMSYTREQISPDQGRQGQGTLVV